MRDELDLNRPSSPEREALETYAAWLFFERRRICKELWPDFDAEEFVKVNNPAFSWHGFDSAPASSRAEAVLRLAGCPATRDEAFEWYKRMPPRSAGNNDVA